MKIDPKVINAGSGGIIVFEEKVDSSILENELQKRGGIEHSRLWDAPISDLLELIKTDWKKVSEWGLFFLVEDTSFDVVLNSLSYHFRLDKAGGGVVSHDGKYLMIKRNGMWEFPKGKMEKGENIEETSLREVEEETGVKAIIQDALVETHHLFYRKEKFYHKHTFWYSMAKLAGGIELIPQEKEGITEVGFYNYEEAKPRVEGSYENISRVWEAYCKLYKL